MQPSSAKTRPVTSAPSALKTPDLFAANAEGAGVSCIELGEVAGDQLKIGDLVSISVSSNCAKPMNHGFLTTWNGLAAAAAEAAE